MDALDICRRLVLQHMVANPLHGGPGHMDVPMLRELVRDARSLFSADELEHLVLQAEEFNEDGIQARRGVIRGVPSRARPHYAG